MNANCRFQVPPGSMSLRVASPPASARAREGLCAGVGRRGAPVGACSSPSMSLPCARACPRICVLVGVAFVAIAGVLVALCYIGPPVAFSDCRCPLRTPFRPRRSRADGARSPAPVCRSRACKGALARSPAFLTRHRMRQDYPLNLSISLSGGEETNQDTPSNGE